MKLKENNLAFSLIEILIIISIIGILSTFAIIALGSVREKARDTKRKNDISTIGRFMTLSCFLPNDGAGKYDLADLAAELLLQNPKYEKYLKSIPQDPLSGTAIQSNYTYIVNEDGDKCALYANLENKDEKITLKNLNEPTPGMGAGVLKANTTGINNTNIYFQYSN